MVFGGENVQMEQLERRDKHTEESRPAADIIFCGKTDIGMKRSSNQDSIAVHKIATGEVLGVICDGMGGANGGNVASAVAIDAFFDYVETALTAYAALAESMAADYAKRQPARDNSKSDAKTAEPETAASKTAASKTASSKSASSKSASDTVSQKPEASPSEPDAVTKDGKIQTDIPQTESSERELKETADDGTKRRKKNQKTQPETASQRTVTSASGQRISTRIPGVNYSALLESAVEAANDAVWARAEGDAALSGMGTTLVAALVSGNILHAVNVGDSRLYIMQNGGGETGGTIKQISRDHSYVQYLVDIGKLTPEQATISPYKNIITRSVGREKTISADTFTITLSEGMWHAEDFADTREVEPLTGRENLLRDHDARESDDERRQNPAAAASESEKNRAGGVYILMCSDGLSNFVTDEEILSIVCSDETKTLGERGDELIKSANRAGGADNISVVLIKTAQGGSRGGETDPAGRAKNI